MQKAEIELPSCDPPIKNIGNTGDMTPAKVSGSSVHYNEPTLHSSIKTNNDILHRQFQQIETKRQRRVTPYNAKPPVLSKVGTRPTVAAVTEEEEED